MAKGTASAGGRIEKRVLIKASPSIIYHALTEAKDLAAWFCDRAASDPREGGELTAYWKTGKTGQTGRAIFQRIVPNSLLELLWVEEGSGATAQTAQHVLSYTILSRKGSSEVIMCDEGEPLPDEETFAFLDQGWNSALMELKDYCERKERSVKIRT